MATDHMPSSFPWYHHKATDFLALDGNNRTMHIDKNFGVYFCEEEAAQIHHGDLLLTRRLVNITASLQSCRLCLLGLGIRITQLNGKHWELNVDGMVVDSRCEDLSKIERPSLAYYT